MKQTKRLSPKRGQHAKARQAVHRRRPLHKKVLLHPLSVMVLLCTGVLIAGIVLHGQAVNYDVTATVPAAPPTSPAVITQPTNELHVTSSPLTVSGTCPANTYVKLYRNDAFSGVSACTNGSFQIQTDLSGGANSLKARVFNITDQEGPASPTVIVYYDQTAVVPQPPPAPPTTLRVADIDENSYRQGVTQQSSVNPTVTGTAPPFSEVTVTFHSDVRTCKTKADGQGWWSCTLNYVLPAGLHWVDVMALTPGGQQLVFPSFRINARLDLSDLTRFSKPLLINTDYVYQAGNAQQVFNFNLAIAGGVAPYQVAVDWGDGAETHLVRPDQSSFTVSHTYSQPGEYVVRVTITDDAGLTATMQLLAVSTDSIATGTAALDDGPWAALISGIKKWMWIIAPVYLVVILMAFSYWIGEQQVYWRMMNGRRGHGGRGR